MESLFPEFSRFVEAVGLREKKLEGHLAAKIPRILGEGSTRADIDARPAPIERRQDYASLVLPDGFQVPAEVHAEIQQVKAELEREMRVLCSEEGARRLASQVVSQLVPQGGLKNDRFYASGLLLVADKKRETWSWSITEHYPLVRKMPPDKAFIIDAFTRAQEKLQQLLVEPEVFDRQLEIAWHLAKLKMEQPGDVRLIDVARMFPIAVQPERFWSKPARSNFIDQPEGAFIANLRQWLRAFPERRFELVPATLNQTRGGEIIYLPTDPEGTQTRPYIHIRRVASTRE